jgi:hypothetical protein
MSTHQEQLFRETAFTSGATEVRVIVWAADAPDEANRFSLITEEGAFKSHLLAHRSEILDLIATLQRALEV